MNKPTSAGLLAFLLITSSAAAGPFEDGNAAFNQGDYATALRSWRPLADHDDARAQSALGTMYDLGLGVPQDFAEAAAWDRKAADQGDVRAQYSLGVLYAAGSGVPQDYVLAHMWSNLAASRTTASEAEIRNKAIETRDRVAAKMTREQIAEAQKLAREWKPKIIARPQA